MSIKDNILKESDSKYPDTSYEWRHGYVRGVRDTLKHLWLNGWRETDRIIETMDAHHVEHDSILTCHCGIGFATERDLKRHIAVEIASCGYDGVTE